MNGRISTVLVAMGAVVLFAGSVRSMKANSRVEFVLAEPFTFARPPVTNAPQGQ